MPTFILSIEKNINVRVLCEAKLIVHNKNSKILEILGTLGSGLFNLNLEQLNFPLSFELPSRMFRVHTLAWQLTVWKMERGSSKNAF